MNAPKTPVVQPYLCFEGRCEEALEFYKQAIGAEVPCMMRFKDAPPGGMSDCGGPPPPGDKIMHASFKVGESMLMASDGQCTGTPSFAGISLSLAVKDEAESQKAFAALSDGGQVAMPLAKTFWSPSFGMVTDRFGLMWMVMVLDEQCA
jgi:PhnB protein